jgi:hypothetical protein
VLGSTDRGGSPGDNHVHLEPDQLGRQVAQPLLTPLCIAVLHNEVLAFNIAKLAQSLLESLPQVRGKEGRARIEVPNPIHFSRRLRLGCEWCREDDESQRHHKSDGLVLHKNSIARSAGGMS